jgi:hypothetical protein
MAADSPDLASLAKRYVDLWQDQLIALAAHPELAEGLARMLAVFSSGWPSGREHDPAPPRAAPASATPDGGDIDLRELASRIAALEERLARLEAGTQGQRRRTGKKPRRRHV